VGLLALHRVILPRTLCAWLSGVTIMMIGYALFSIRSHTVTQENSDFLRN